MKRITKIRIGLTVVFVLLEFLLLPTLIEFPFYLKKYNVQAMNMWFSEINILGSVQKVFTDKNYTKLFLIFQPLMIILLYSLLWTGAIKRKEVKLDDLGGPPAAGSGEFGTSRWLTNTELEKKTTVWYTDEELKLGGLVLHMEPKGDQYKVYLETNDTHSLDIGTSRSGKTRTNLIPSIWATAHSGESMIINDPKGELYTNTNGFLRQMGYTITLLDFRNPMRGNRWNPMNLILEAIKEQNYSLASESALDMAHTIVHQRPRKGDPIWADGTKAVIASLAMAVAEKATDDTQKHLTSVYSTLVELGTPIQTPLGELVPLNDYFKSMPPGSLAKNLFGPASLASDKTRGSFYSGAATDLLLFSDPGISNLTSYSDHDLADVGRRKTAVFLIVPDEKSTRHVLASLYVDQTYQALVQLANESRNGRLPVRVNHFLDEFGNMPPINGFDNKITVAAGRGIRYHLVIQDFGQLHEKYGDKARTIKNNTHTWIYLLTKDSQTAEEISKMTGTYTVESQNVSTNIQAKSSYSHGLSSSLTGRALLTPDEVKRNPYGQGIVFLQREYPAKTNLPDYSEGPAKDDIVEKEPTHVPHPFVTVPLYIPGVTDQEDESGEVQGLPNQTQPVTPKSSILAQLDSSNEVADAVNTISDHVDRNLVEIEEEGELVKRIPLLTEEATSVAPVMNEMNIQHYESSQLGQEESIPSDEMMEVFEEIELPYVEEVLVEELEEIIEPFEEVAISVEEIDFDDFNLEEELIIGEPYIKSTEEKEQKKFSLSDLN